MAVGMDVDVAAGVEMSRTFGSARRAKWPSEIWHGSVEWNVAGVLVAGFVAQRETWNDRLFPCGRVDPKTTVD